MGVSLKETYNMLLAKGGYNDNEINSKYKSLNDLKTLLNSMNEYRSKEIDEDGLPIQCNSHTNFSVSENKRITLHDVNKSLSNGLISELVCPSEITYMCNCNTQTGCSCHSRTLLCEEVISSTVSPLCSTRTTVSTSCNCNSVSENKEEVLSTCECNTVNNLVSEGYYYYNPSSSCACNGKEYEFVSCGCNSRTGSILCESRVSTGISYMCTTRTTWTQQYEPPVYSSDVLCPSRTTINTYTENNFLCPSRTTINQVCDCNTRTTYFCGCNTRSESLCETRINCICNEVCDCNTVKLFE